MSHRVVWVTHGGVYAELRGDTELALTPDTVESFQCTGRESSSPDRYAFRRTRSYMTASDSIRSYVVLGPMRLCHTDLVTQLTNLHISAG